MPFLISLYAVFLIALMFSGVDKLIRPKSAAAALSVAGLVPRRRVFGRSLAQALVFLLGAAEVGLGAGALVLALIAGPQDRRLAASAGLVAALYLGFTWFLGRVEAVDPQASCGCFGRGSAPGRLHRGANLLAAFVSGATAVTVLFVSGDAGPVTDNIGGGGRLAFAVLAVLASIMFLTAPSLLTDLQRAQRPTGPSVRTFTISESLLP